MYQATGENDMFQYLDQGCLGLGGGADSGRFAVFLGADFLMGSSHKTECFNNEVVSSKQEFTCINMEVWGFK